VARPSASRRHRHVALAALALSCGGCATVYTLSSDRVEGTMQEDRSLPRSFPRVYSGVLGDGWCVAHSPSAQPGFFCLLDVPLSLALDTVVLPYTAYQQIRFGNFHPRLVASEHAAALQRTEYARSHLRGYCRNVTSVDGGTPADRDLCAPVLAEPDAGDAR
jgi:uncharacterized protein YceK